MARFPKLVDALAEVDGRPRGVLDHMAREIREAGLIQTTGAGWAAAQMTSLDAAHLILGVYGSSGRGDAAEVSGILGGLRRTPLNFLLVETHPHLHPLVRVIADQPTLAEAVAAVIELGPELAEQTGRTQSTLPSWSMFARGEESMRELDDDWPEGLSVMLRINRPTLEPYLHFAWRGPDLVEDVYVDYMFGRPDDEGRRQIAGYEVATFVHANIFRAMHRVLFSTR
jgi:hypothetical protein